MNGADTLTQSDHDYDGHQGHFSAVLAAGGRGCFLLWARFHCGCPRRDLSRYDVASGRDLFAPIEIAWYFFATRGVTKMMERYRYLLIIVRF
jgi:hypothetical protein